MKAACKYCDRVIVMGAGPAGLAGAWTLIEADRSVTVLESDPQFIGGLARTLLYQGCRFDIGAHRFFSKNAEITRWWHERLPTNFIRIKRRTRILYRNRFFDYPLFAADALRKLGIPTSAACLGSYGKRRLFPVRPELSFADWVRNRFGDRLYEIFFKTYTEKVWGMSCDDISADWASQRIKGLSLVEAITRRNGHTVKTLVDEFEYPRRGPGQLWEKVRDEIVERGGCVKMGRKVTRLHREGNRLTSVTTVSADGENEDWPADQFIVSMPLSECVLGLDPSVGPAVQAAARGLRYRDFLTVVLILNRRDLFPDQWLYIHDPEVRVARIENYNNWSPDMVPDKNVTCLQLEYFCNIGDDLWRRSDAELIALAKGELAQLGLAKAADVTDGCVVRVEKAYPVYDATYRENVNVIRQALTEIENLQVIGRNGMHKYNNQDHSMLTGMLAAKNLNGGRYDVWRVNTDAEYHESGEVSDVAGRSVPMPRA